ncbi:glycosyltransferase family 29 protein [Microbacterium sp.]|uniref:glycosyltransferase family 29 protein n=1 Tax=Microbacterium sp. TaxID=51671 RepID=UPI002810C3A5|nr:glycosyltransferase family 29 protein [Microbacterium sp.]
MDLLNSLKKNATTRKLVRKAKSIPGGRTALEGAARVLRRVDALRNGPEPFSVDPVREQDFHMLRAEWRDRGPSEMLLAQARAMQDNTIAWNALHPSTWLVYAGALAERGETDAAGRILRRYAAKFGADGIAQVLPLARLAHEIGLRTAAIDRAAAVTNAFTAAGAADRFRAIVEKGTVAVVGNGPGNLDTGRGAEIDAHDVVIRFNNHPDGYEDDYGSRTDIWVRGAHRDVRDRHDLRHIALVVWEMDLFRNVLEDASHLEILFRDTLFSPEKITWIQTETKRTLREASGLMLPTSGAQVLWALHQARGDLEGVDVYGFSGLDGSNDHGHYYDKLGDMAARHDADAEGAFVRSLIRRDVPLVQDDHVVVFNCAYRAYDPSRGRTGGPAGVLATQRKALGDAHAGHELRYIFDEGDKADLRHRVGPRIAGLGGKVADILLGAEYFSTHPEVRAAQSAGRNMFAVCHELGTALGARQLGIPYVIVYHQQGSTLQELRSIGREPSAQEVLAATRLEELICAGAEKVYFPSMGARATFEATAGPAIAARAPLADTALYNTVSAVDHGDEDRTVREELLRKISTKLNLPVKDADTDVFLSVGDWNEDKGLDRVPALLSRHAERSGRKILWLAIGSASSRSLFNRMTAAKAGWNFEARLIGERMTHDRLLALLDYADYYVMMHRNAIFDLATLEAMRAGKALILSPVGGNPEVNLAGNVEFVTEERIDEVCDAIARRDREEWGDLNRSVFDDHFSLGHFADRYRGMLDEHLARLAGATPQ